MKTFKGWRFWMLLGFVMLVGAFFIGSFVFQNQSPVITDVDAQMVSVADTRSSEYDLGGVAPRDILFSQETFFRSQSWVPYSNTLPGDVMFDSRTHPGSYMFYQTVFPGDIVFPGDTIWKNPEKGSSGKTKMRTIMTCSGCALTMATCDWNCGRTFSFCNTGSGYGSGYTGLTCPGPTGLICDSGGNTNIVCTSGFCGSGSNTLMTCSGDIFCSWSEGNTSRTCDILGCRSPGVSVVYPGGGNTLISCSSSLYGLCGLQIRGIYGGSTIDFYGGAITFEAGSPPPF